MTLTLALVALAVSTTVSLIAPNRTIFWYVIFGWSGIAATFCPMMILALAWPRYNAPGALASMVAGIMAVPVFTFGVPYLPVWGPLLSRPRNWRRRSPCLWWRVSSSPSRRRGPLAARGESRSGAIGPDTRAFFMTLWRPCSRNDGRSCGIRWG